MTARRLAMDTTSFLLLYSLNLSLMSIMFIVHAKPVDGAYFWNEFVVTVQYLGDDELIKLQLQQHTE